MEFTDQMYIGQIDGRTVAMAWKCAGKSGEKFNRDTIQRWIKRGYDIQTVHKSETDAHYAQMRAAAV